MFNKFYSSESGNIFFALFGAVIIVGLLGTVVVSTMRGPLSTMVNVQTRTKAESEMDIASRLVLLEATQLANDGDCDSDGFVEPLEYKDASGAGPTGGGFLPNVIASSRIDPWGIEYGYCAWDAGGTTNAIACDTDSSGNNDRLDGNGDPSDETYTVIAIISAGQDQIFQTVCNGGGSPSIAKGGDDIVVEFTYGTAIAATNGLWNIKSGDPSTAEIGKNLEVTGGASFTAGIDLTSSTAALQLGAASMLFPNETTLITCNGANGGLIRIDTSSDPDVLQICDAVNGWVPVSSSFWSAGAGNDIYYNSGTPQVGIGTTTPAEALDVAGNIALTGNLVAGGSLSGADLSATGNAVIGGTLSVTGATTLTTLNSTAAVDFDTTLNVDGATTLGGTLNVAGSSIFVGTIDAQGTISSSTGDLNIGDNLIVTGTSDLQGAISSSTGNLVLNDAVDITGAIDAQNSISSSTGNLALSDNVDVTGDASVSGDITGTNITASATLNAGTTVNVNGDQLGPALNCAAAQKLVWTNGAGWSCDVDLQGGSGGGTPNLQDVLTTGNDAATLSAVNLGGVGIGTASPSAELHIDEGDLLVTGTYTGTSAVPVSGAGTRMFFQPATGAFRAGSTGITWDAGAWDDANIGNHSVAMGRDNTASGLGSTAFGGFTRAWGDYSLATGWNNRSSGYASFSGGSGVYSQGSSSFGYGAEMTVSGDRSFGFGRHINVSGAESVGFGLGASGNSTKAVVSGTRSFGVFMGNHPSANMTAANTMGLFGGTMVIDSAVPATQLAASTGGEQDLELDVTGDIGADNYCDASGNNCFVASDVGATGSGIWEIVSNVTRVKSSAGDYTNDDFVFGSPQLADDTDPNHDARMFFDKSKSAFRAGSADGTQWDDANIALGSAAFGINAQARNNASFAAGNNSYAGGISAVALGNGANAGQNRSIAIGEGASAGDFGSIALGWGTSAGVSGVAIGKYINVTGIGSIGLSGHYNPTGPQALVSATDSFGFFMGDQTSVDLSTANTMGVFGGTMVIDSAIPATVLAAATGGTQDLELHVEGDIGAVNYCDNAGNNCFVSSDIAAGNSDIFEVTGAAGSEVVSSIDANVPYTTADFVFGSPQLDDDTDPNHYNRMYFDKSKGAFRVGYASDTRWNAVAAGDHSVAMGHNVRASGVRGVALGSATTASGGRAMATGADTTASGYASISMGSNITAGNGTAGNGLGDGSMALGLIDDAVTITTPSQVTGIQSMGIFMGDQDGLVVSTNNQMSLLGGSMVIDPAVPATNLVADTALEIEGSIKIADGGEACAAGVAGAMRYNTNTIDFCDGTTWTTLSSGASTSDIFEVTGAAGSEVVSSIDANVPYTTADFVFGSPQLDYDGDTNHNSRMFFDKSKAAFRVGSTNGSGTQWDNANIGVNSIAMGNGTNASANSSLAIGLFSIARGVSSIAIGQEVVADGARSFALGLGDATAAYPQVTGASSFGIFMGDQSGVDVAQANTMALMGGSLGIGTVTPTSPLHIAYAGGTEDTNPATITLNNTTIQGSSILQFREDTDYGMNVEYWSSADGTQNQLRFEGSLLGTPTGKIVSIDRNTSHMGILTTPATALDVAGTVKIADGGEACAAGVAGAMRYNTSTIDFCDGTSWTTLAATGGNASLSGLTAANATNTIANANFAQAWNWGTLTTETAMALGSTSITSGKILDINSSATAFTGTMADVTLSGDNASNTGTVLKSSVTGTSSAATPLIVTNAGTGATLRINDDGTDTDTTPFIIDASGNVGIGTSSPATALHVLGAITVKGADPDIATPDMSTLALGANNSADQLVLHWNGQNVGISAGAPDQDLEVKDGGNVAIRINSGDTSKWDLETEYNTSDNYNEDLIIKRISGAGDLIFDTGFNVGVGINNPATLLDISGTIKIADGGEACAAGVAGAIRYNTSTIDFCDGTSWTTLASSGAGSSLSDISAATATNTIANANYAQVWNWDTLTTETAMSLASTSITSGKVLYINSTATGFTGTLADITSSGSNAANTGTVLKASVTGALSNAIPLMVTNLGVGDSFRVNDGTGDADTTPFIIDNSGNVGIGTASPTAPLMVDITAGSGFITVMRLRNLTNGDGQGPSIAFANGDIDLGYIGATRGATNGASRLHFRTVAGEKMTIDTTGFVGINTTTPATQLDVGGSVKIADGGEACAAGVAGAMRYNTSTIDFCNGTAWITLAASGGTASLSGLTAATATNTIANANFAQTWNWDTLTTESAMTLGSTSITSGKILDINSSATAFTGTMADVTLSGDNASNTGTVLKSSVTGSLSAAVPIMATNAGTGASLRVNDDGTDTDTTPFIIDNAGQVGVGTSSPAYSIDIVAQGSGEDGIRIHSTTAHSRVIVSSDTDIKNGGYQLLDEDTDTQYGMWLLERAALDGSGLAQNDVVLRTRNGSNLILSTEDTRRIIILPTGEVGVGIDAPTTRLDVSGTVKIADGGEACAAGVAGAMRYNTNTIDFCDGTSWTTLAASGGNASLSGLTAATATNTIANANYAQAWNWDTLTTETAMALGSTSITSGELLDVFSRSTGLTGALGNFSLTGNNAANTGTVLKASVTGTSSAAVPIMATNAGTGASLRVNDDGTDTDTTPFIIDNAGNVGIGETNPQTKLDLGEGSLGQRLLIWSGNGNLDRAGLGVDMSGDSFETNLFGVLEGGPNQRGHLSFGFVDSADGTTYTENMRLNETGQLGIGTTTPNAMLDVSGTIVINDGGEACSASLAGGMRYNSGTIDYCDSTNWTTLDTAGGAVALSNITNATAANTLVNGGNTQTWNWDSISGATAFSIGSTSVTSGKVLDINSTATAFTGTLADITLSGSNAANTGTVLKSSVTGALSNATPLIVTNLGVGDSFRVNDATGDGDTTPFIIDNAGNVGIGTTTPNALLNVTGAGDTVEIARLSNTAFGSDNTLLLENTNGGGNAATLGFMVSGTQQSTLYGWDAGLDINTTGEIWLTTDSTVRMTVKQAGNIGIGTSSPQASLDVAGTDAVIVSRGTEAQRPATAVDGMIRYKTDTGTSSIGFEVREAGAWVAMGAAVSDKRLKENIKPLSGKEILDRLAKINTYSYTMKNDKTGRKQYGVIAQELSDTFPELVDGTPDDSDNMMSVRYISLIAPMIEATKELKSENDMLKNNITALKTAQNETNATLKNINEQITLLNRAAGNNVGKASMQPFLLLLLGLIAGMGIIIIIQRKKIK